MILGLYILIVSAALALYSMITGNFDKSLSIVIIALSVLGLLFICFYAVSTL
jgi:hypothetical protein